MAYNYDINHTEVDKRAQRCLLTSHTLAQIVNLFVTTFLVAHIYSFNGNTYDYLFNVAVYNIFLYLFVALLYIPFSKIVDKTNRVVVYRISLVLKTVLVIFFIFFGKQLAELLILAGALNGLSEALYFSSYNVLRQEMVSRKTSSNYSSYIYMLAKLVEVVCPVALGALIDSTGFSVTAIAVFGICVAQLIISIWIKAQRPEGSEFNLKKYFNILKERKEVRKKIGYMYIISAIYGVSILTTTVINACIMLQFGSNLSLGTITSVFSVVAIIVIYLIKRFTKSGKRTWLFIVGAVFPLAAVIVFVVNISPTTVVILNGAIAVTCVIYKVLFDAHRNGILKEEGLYDQIAEHHSMIEILANASRAICFAVLLLISLAQSILVFKIFVVLTIIGCGGVFMLLLIYEIKYFKTSKKENVVLKDVES
ncbi:MAG: MFS transporter [Clostridia bacterium]|nr:MFS transporter [Clostridia bacterium]